MKTYQLFIPRKIYKIIMELLVCFKIFFNPSGNIGILHIPVNPLQLYQPCFTDPFSAAMRIAVTSIPSLASKRSMISSSVIGLT